jgi:hypothetical protein
MLRAVLGISVSMLLPMAALGQQYSHVDTIPSSPFYNMYEFMVQVPLGQTFVAPARCSGATTARYSLPAGKPDPICLIDTTAEQHVRASLTMGMQSNAQYKSRSNTRGTATMVSYQMSGSMTINEDPSEYLMEVAADPLVPMMMKMNLGYGSARLDLAELNMKHLDIVSAAADVYISYSKPSGGTMKVLNVSNGMNKIVIRNLECARAERVHIENAIGDTKIVVGKESYGKSLVTIEVGAGNCTLLVQKDAPVKIVVHGTVFSSTPIPDGYVKLSDNTFTSKSYKMNCDKAMTIEVNLSIGGFEMIPYE